MNIWRCTTGHVMPEGTEVCRICGAGVSADAGGGPAEQPMAFSASGQSGWAAPPPAPMAYPYAAAPPPKKMPVGKIIAGIVAVMVLIAIVVISAGALLVRNVVSTVSEASAAGEAISAQVFAGDATGTYAAAHPEFREAVTIEEWSAVVQQLADDDAKVSFSSKGVSSSTGRGTVAELSGKVTGLNVPASITVTLKKAGEQWLLLGFNVQA